MSQKKQQQQQQPPPTTSTTNNKKKKYSKTNTVAVENKDLCSGATVGGGDAAVVPPPTFTVTGGHKHGNNNNSSSSANSAVHKEKKPLHTSMEQLREQLQALAPTPAEASTKNITILRRNSTGSNWSSRRNSLERRAQSKNECSPASKQSNEENNAPHQQSKAARKRQKRKSAQQNKYVAIDCEMVGVGHNGQDDMLARVSIVNKRGEVLLDKFVKPRETVTDYRTSISGIRPNDIEHGEEFDEVQDEVVELLQGKILVGHAIRNDLAVLHIKHPYKNIRDTSRYKPLCRLVSNGRTPSLKRLSQAILGLEIQTGEHNSVEDARAAMDIYNRLSSDWEKDLQKLQQHRAGH